MKPALGSQITHPNGNRTQRSAAKLATNRPTRTAIGLWKLGASGFAAGAIKFKGGGDGGGSTLIADTFQNLIEFAPCLDLATTRPLANEDWYFPSCEPTYNRGMADMLSPADRATPSGLTRGSVVEMIDQQVARGKRTLPPLGKKLLDARRRIE